MLCCSRVVTVGEVVIIKFNVANLVRIRFDITVVVIIVAVVCITVAVVIVTVAVVVITFIVVFILVAILVRVTSTLWVLVYLSA